MTLPDEAAVRRDLAAIIEFIGDRLVLPSCWNGEVQVDETVLFAGRLAPDGTVLLSAMVVSVPTQYWRTLIHEALHTFSRLGDRSQYRAAPGWEEGIVEQTQRLLRPEIIASLTVGIDEAEFRAGDASHPYNGYITALEQVRLMLAAAPLPFYRNLLDVEVAFRYSAVEELIENLPPVERTDALTSLRLCHAVLTRSTGIQ